MTTYNRFKQLNIDTAPLGIELADDEMPPEPGLPEWRVYFDGNFRGESYYARQRAGKEIPANKQFILNDKTWRIPSVYSCSKGLVLDFCVQIPAAGIRDFIARWNLSAENDGSEFTREQQRQLEAENPMGINISPEIVLNGKIISSSHGCGLSWNPCFPDLNSMEAEGVLQHYDLDPAWGWTIWRAAFPWATVRKPQISSLSVIIKHDPVEVGGIHFRGPIPGEGVDFIHPVTGVEHTLTIQDYEQQEMPVGRLADNSYEYPAHCTVMSYSICPDLPDGSFSLRDHGGGDRPRRKRVHPFEPQTEADCFAIAVIGGAAGPTAVFTADGRRERLYAACSALYFDPPDVIEWQIIFHEKPCTDMTVEII